MLTKSFTVQGVRASNLSLALSACVAFARLTLGTGISHFLFVFFPFSVNLPFSFFRFHPNSILQTTFNIRNGDNSKGILAIIPNNVINKYSFKLEFDKFDRRYFPRVMTAKRIVANLDMPIVEERVCQ